MPQLRFGQYPAQQPEADSGDISKQRWCFEHGAVGRPGSAAERLVCVAADSRRTGQGSLSALTQCRLVLRSKALCFVLTFLVH